MPFTFRQSRRFHAVRRSKLSQNGIGDEFGGMSTGSLMTSGSARRLDDKRSDTTAELGQGEDWWFRTTKKDLRQASIDLQRGLTIDSGFLIQMMGAISAHLSEDMNLEDKRTTYFFLMSILSSDNLEISTFSGLPFWQNLMDFTSDFDQAYWETEAV